MTDRPILRLPKSTPGKRLLGTPDRRRRPKGVGTQLQESKYGSVFSNLEAAIQSDATGFTLRQSPNGIAPERALVFEVIDSVGEFVRAATKAGFEHLFEERLSPEYEVSADMADEDLSAASPTLYAVLPTIKELKLLLSLWEKYKKREKMPRGLAPWGKLFDLLSDLRVWGPQDRLSKEALKELRDELKHRGDEPINLELEIWPILNAKTRAQWRDEVSDRVRALGGHVLSTSSIAQPGLIYEAILASMPSNVVQAMLEDPSIPHSLATLDGLQFVLPQAIAQSLPNQSEEPAGVLEEPITSFDEDAPIRAVLLDGTPVAAHPALKGGVVIEDIHELERLSEVEHRKHATSMASLILRGDLEADCQPLRKSRILSIPVLVDTEGGAFSPRDRLFVDILHTSLARAFMGDDALAPDAHVVNLSIGISGSNFAGKISSLARVLDWWAAEYGILFAISAGNILDDLLIPDVRQIEFEDGNVSFRRELVEEAQAFYRHERTLLAPSEAINALTIGASSLDYVEPMYSARPGDVSIHEEGEVVPALYSAHGPGPFRSIKPEVLVAGGSHDLRGLPSGDNFRLRVNSRSQRTGLTVARAKVFGGEAIRERGTSCATALASRALVSSVVALEEQGGPYAGMGLSPIAKALTAKALIVHSARWNDQAWARYERALKREGDRQHLRAKEEVSRYFGYGLLDADLMLRSPDDGATLIGFGSLKKDHAAIFEVPLPPSMSGSVIPREMLVTVSWFSPVSPTRAQYRLSIIEALIDGEMKGDAPSADKTWGMNLKGHQLDQRQIGRGTVWSKRLKSGSSAAPVFEDNHSLSLRVQCRECAKGALDKDDEISFAIAVTLLVQATPGIDIFQEIRGKLQARVNHNLG